MEWKVIESYFERGYLERLVRHQIESYNEFIGKQLEATLEMFNPVVVHSDQYYNKDLKLYSLEAVIRFTNLCINRPQIHENNGSSKLMFPQEARFRNFTYAAGTTVDVEIVYTIRSGAELDTVQTVAKTIKNVHLGKIPVMLKSSLCVLTQYAHLPSDVTGECKYDPGGYFIINGSEKTILAQERAAENKVYCFPANNAGHKYLWQAELKSVPDSKRISPKQVNMYLVKMGSVTAIQVAIPRIRKNIPLFILFRSLGVLTDVAICKMITLVNDPKLVECLKGSIIEAAECRTQEDAITYIAGHAMFMAVKLDKPQCCVKRREFTVEVLASDLFPHCRSRTQQIYMLGYMACKLLRCSVGQGKGDDRDTYLNKRVDLPGALMNNLYRNYLNKMIKDMQKQIVREMNTGSWKSTNDYSAIVNPTNIYKVIKSNTIENGIKRALSTGDFGLKLSSSKVGVAQVLNRLTYTASLSHLRRINTPTPSDKSGKLIAPRKLHASTWGYVCPAETPEGQSVGVVKNMSYMTHITTCSDADPLYMHVTPHVTPLDALTDETIQETKVFINGCWVGNCCDDSQKLFLFLKSKKYSGCINPYTGIVFDYAANEIHVCNDAGRVMRPVFRLVDGEVLPITEPIVWDALVVGANSVLEYIDPAEQNASLIAMRPTDKGLYTHRELHPSTIFGVLASCIPFPDHNQSPRNTYQCAMGKQAIGVYVTNPHMRMDKTSYVLTYPHRALVDTRVMTMLRLNDIPSGKTVVVAIMSLTGYNQEDSVMISQGAIDRGLFMATIYHTDRDEDKKLHGDDEVRCNPDPSKTRGMKFGNYDKLGGDGLIPENTLIENMDIIMGKVVPIREARNDPSKPKKFDDLSRFHRTDERCYMDKNYIGVNGDGYSFWKGRIRCLRKPEIGDKFSSRHGQKGTVGNIIPEADMPFTASGLKPDIIINPHAIPSRMTIAQLKETLLGKVLAILGLYGDGTAFTGLTVARISEDLLKLGYESRGNELMYNGMTGEQLKSDIFIGPVFYQRLKHMVIDKQHSRSSGPMVSLTRQPAEGRARDGGLRFGEMERDCMVSHGAAMFTKGRVYDASDKYVVHTCKKCGLIAAYNDTVGIHYCRNCENRTDFAEVKIPYACKLLFQELITMNIAPRFLVKDSP
jgi:DNA-directed RNA polymerase II subunit RPB2